MHHSRSSRRRTTARTQMRGRRERTEKRTPPSRRRAQHQEAQQRSAGSDADGRGIDVGGEVDRLLRVVDAPSPEFVVRVDETRFEECRRRRFVVVPIAVFGLTFETASSVSATASRNEVRSFSSNDGKKAWGASPSISTPA